MTPPSGRRHAALAGLKAWDLLIGAACLGLLVHDLIDLHPEAGARWLDDLPTLALAGALFLVGWHLILASRGLYDSRRIGSISRELTEVLLGSLLATGLLVVELVFVDMGNDIRLPALSFFAALSIASMASRVLMRLGLRAVRVHGRNLRFVLIVGSGPRAQRIARSIVDSPELGYRIVGFVDDQNLGIGDVPALGTLEDLPQVLSSNVIDEIFVALPIRSRYAETERVALEAEKQGVPVMLLPDLFALKLARTRVGLIGESAVVRFTSGPEIDGRLLVKRLIDITLSGAALVLFSPLMAGIAIAVRSTSPGPALFRQARVGLNKRPFTLYKFRTMGIDAEQRQQALEVMNESDGAAFKIRNDPRVTRLGQFLRRTSLDELPQLFNVLKGEMSLVGPRPLPMRDVERFKEDWQRRRFSALPGLTCLWQVSGRSDIGFEQWMRLDLEYIDQWSLTLDLKILMDTVRVVLKRQGAY